MDVDACRRSINKAQFKSKKKAVAAAGWIHIHSRRADILHIQKKEV